MSERVTASRMLMDLMESFGNNEPDTILVVCTFRESEDVELRSNMQYMELIGAAEFAKARAMQRLKGE